MLSRCIHERRIDNPKAKWFDELHVSPNRPLGPKALAFQVANKFYGKSNQFGYFFVYLRMNIYNRSSLTAFYKEHPDCKATLEKWYHDVVSKNWKKPGDITRDFNTARTIKNSRAIFEINHNDYRLIAEVNYQKGWVFIKFIGTHTEYDKEDAASVNLFKNQKRKL